MNGDPTGGWAFAFILPRQRQVAINRDPTDLNHTHVVRFTVQDETGRAVAQGYTPQTVDLAKSNGTYFGKKHYQVMLESPGYVPLTLPIEASANLWYVLGNIPLLGFPGWLVVDPFYGGMYDLKPAHPQPHLNVVGARGG